MRPSPNAGLRGPWNGVYRRIDGERITETVEKLSQRIQERFPGSGLGSVCDELLVIAREGAERRRLIGKPNVAVRISVGILLFLIIGALFRLFSLVSFNHQIFEVSQFLQSFDAMLESLVYLGATGIFLVTVEGRFKRRKALKAIFEMRAFAHVVDMHQLTKDPEVLIFEKLPTVSSPTRVMTAFELSRYFDYCSEMLSMISKVAALYIQDFKDPVAMDAVDQVEDLTTGLSQKIWQKAALLNRV